jgi:hypothetical protein
MQGDRRPNDSVITAWKRQGSSMPGSRTEILDTGSAVYLLGFGWSFTIAAGRNRYRWSQRSHLSVRIGRFPYCAHPVS